MVVFNIKFKKNMDLRMELRPLGVSSIVDISRLLLLVKTMILLNYKNKSRNVLRTECREGAGYIYYKVLLFLGKNMLLLTYKNKSEMFLGKKSFFGFCCRIILCVSNA